MNWISNLALVQNFGVFVAVTTICTKKLLCENKTITRKRKETHKDHIIINLEDIMMGISYIKKYIDRRSP